MKVNFKLILVIITAFLIYIFLAYIYIEQNARTLQEHKYLEVSKDSIRLVQTLIDAKKEAVSLISLILSRNESLKNALISRDMNLDYLKDFSHYLDEHTAFKNTWFQVLSPEGVSLYRSWTKKHGDNVLKIRLDIVQMIQNPKISSSISTGKFDITFKVMVPIYKDKKFIGIVETIAKFNSILAKLHKSNIETLLVVDKSYKKQLTRPFTKRFIKDYYIANTHPNEKLLSICTKEDLSSFLHIKTYMIDKKNGLLFSTYQLLDVNGGPMAYFILSKDLHSLDMSEVVNLTKNMIIIFISIALLIVVSFYYIYNLRYKNHMQEQNKRLKKIVKLKTKELYHAAYHDSLTGLPNRSLFLDRLEQTLKHSVRNDTHVSVLFLDLDKFKEVNDTYGHHIGDELLKKVTQRLHESLREEDTIARLGGDEFTIIIQNSNNESMIQIAKSIINNMQKVFSIEDIQLHITFSIGIASFPSDGFTVDELVQHADTAMYKAKELGENNFQFYNQRF